MLKSELWPNRCVIYQTKVLAEAKAPLIGMDSVLLWHSATPLSTFESGLPVSSFCLQDNNNAECPRLAQAAANLSARSESQGSHCTYLHSPDALPGWAQTQHLIIFSNTVEKRRLIVSRKIQQSRSSTVCLPSLGQRQGAMAVANFHYITRMSSGFKVYILEGELDNLFFFYRLMLLMR